ncbi:unnamed protein product [Cunninghamella echinulata]
MDSATNVNTTIEEPEKTTVFETQVMPAPISKVNVWQVKQSVETIVVPIKEISSLPAPKEASEKKTKKKQGRKDCCKKRYG